MRAVGIAQRFRWKLRRLDTIDCVRTDACYSSVISYTTTCTFPELGRITNRGRGGGGGGRKGNVLRFPDVLFLNP